MYKIKIYFYEKNSSSLENEFKSLIVYVCLDKFLEFKRSGDDFRLVFVKGCDFWDFELMVFKLNWIVARKNLSKSWIKPKKYDYLK